MVMNVPGSSAKAGANQHRKAFMTESTTWPVVVSHGGTGWQAWLPCGRACCPGIAWPQTGFPHTREWHMERLLPRRALAGGTRYTGAHLPAWLAAADFYAV